MSPILELYGRRTRKGVTTSRMKTEIQVASGETFSTSYRDISVIVAENNSVIVKPKYQQFILR